MQKRTPPFRGDIRYRRSFRYDRAEQPLPKMPQHELLVVLITQAKRFAQNTHCAAARPFLGQLGGFLAGACVSPAGGYPAWVQDSMRWPLRGETIRRPARGRTVTGASVVRASPI